MHKFDPHFYSSWKCILVPTVCKKLYKLWIKFLDRLVRFCCKYSFPFRYFTKIMLIINYILYIVIHISFNKNQGLLIKLDYVFLCSNLNNVQNTCKIFKKWVRKDGTKFPEKNEWSYRKFLEFSITQMFKVNVINRKNHALYDLL